MNTRDIHTAFVTGGTGFIGSRLIAELVRTGVHVRALVRSADEQSAWPRDVEVVAGDLFDTKALAAGADQADVVFHLAGIGSPSSDPRHHPDIIRTNAIGTMNVLVAAANNGAKRVVLSSSASVYGRTDSVSLSEDMKPEPASVYASSKHIAEEMCAAATRHQGLETVILRYFNVYGPDEPADSQSSRLIPSLLHHLSRLEPVTVHGRGDQIRDFIYVDDAVQAAILAGQLGNMKHEILNIGSGQGASVMDVIMMLKENLGSTSRIVHAPTRHTDVQHSVSSMEKARDLLGFMPQVGLRDGLERVVAQMTSTNIGANC